MAIFYNHIKGCGVNTTGQDQKDLELTDANGDLHNECWGWITWPSKLKYVKNTETTSGIADFRYVANCPELRFHNINRKPADTANTLSLGKFILSDARYQSIDRHFRFNDTMDIYSSGNTKVLMTSNEYGSNKVVTIHQDCWMTSGKSLMFSDSEYSSETSYGRFAHIYWNKTTKTDGTVESNRWFFNMVGDKTASMEFSAPAFWFHAGNVNITTALTVTKDITSSSYCQALYFNATSDRRAKSNITPAKFSALQVVNSLPTYTFNYKGKEEKTLGLIAQEAAEFNLDGFNMVDNLEATGQDDDFMQMKESKLVYVLWKAVQELSAEVEDLKSQIHNPK